MFSYCTCQLSLFKRDCPYFDPNKARKKSDFTMCPYFFKNLSVVFNKCIGDFPAICPYFLHVGFRIGKYATVMNSTLCIIERLQELRSHALL